MKPLTPAEAIELIRAHLAAGEPHERRPADLVDTIAGIVACTDAGSDSFDRIHQAFTRGPLACWDAVDRLVALGFYDRAQAEQIVTAWTEATYP